MKILIFSDSHGKYLNMQKAIDLHEDIEYILHLGDGLADLENINPHNTQIIKTNGNFEDSFFSPQKSDNRARIIELGGKKIFICHGHRYGVSGSLQRLAYTAIEQNADVALFGHTHVKINQYIPPANDSETDKGLYIFNPGSISRPRDSIYSSFGVMEIQDNGILLSHGLIKA